MTHPEDKAEYQRNVLAEGSEASKPVSAAEPVRIQRLTEQLVRIADASRRADGSDIPLGEQVRQAADALAALQAEVRRLTQERDWQYDENINRIAAEGAALLRVEELVAENAQLIAAIEGVMKKAWPDIQSALLNGGGND